jgi:hypothetical protein
MNIELNKLIGKYQKQWDKNGMGSGISYSSLISDLEKLRSVKSESISGVVGTLVCDNKGVRCQDSSMDRNGYCRICGEDIAN